MRKKQKPSPTDQTAEARKKTPTFLLEVPLRVTAGQAKRLRAHLEAARQFYNAILSEGNTASAVCVLIPVGKLLAPFRALRIWNAPGPLERCERSTAFQSMPCMRRPKS